MALAQGSEAQRQMLQDAINRFWWPALMMFGPNDDNSPNSARSLAWKIKRFGNDELRQRFTGRGICNHERLAAKRKAWDDGAWVREAALAHAEKQRARQAA